MSIHILQRQVWIPHPLEEVFPFFAEARNLERLTPPFLKFRVLTPEPIEMRPGALIDYKLRVRGLPIRWRTEILEWKPPYEFVDTQLKGPYKLWHHTHRFRAQDGGTQMEDIVRYELPFGVLGNLAHALQVRRDVEQIFEYRTQQIKILFPGAAIPLEAGV